MVTSLLPAIFSQASTFASTIVSAADEDAATVQTADMAAVGSFLVIGLITLATIFLILDMIRRMRRTKYREQVRAEIAAELAAQEAQTEQASKTGKPAKTNTADKSSTSRKPATDSASADIQD